jgi:hypothetical protein
MQVYETKGIIQHRKRQGVLAVCELAEIETVCRVWAKALAKCTVVACNIRQVL